MSVYTEDRRVAFVHIPKCAGWSVKQWLSDNADGLVVPAHTRAAEFEGVTARDDMPVGHLRLADWERYTGIAPAEFDTIIAVVRNPYEHALSQWSFWRASFDVLQLNHEAAPMVQHVVARQYRRFEDWLSDPRWQYYARYDYHESRPMPKFLGEDAPGYADHGGYFPYWLAVDGEIPDNVRILRINRLDTELPAALGITDGTTLPHTNTTSTALTLGEHYTPEAQAIVEREYAWAFNGWYEKGGFQCAPSAGRKRYQSIAIDDMPDDPAQVAGEVGLVGVHAPAVARKVGVWRWHGIYEHRDRILDIVRQADSVVDLGGASGPLGYGATIVDPESDLTSLYDIEGQVDVVFTSHTLEHLRDVELALSDIAAKVVPGGYLIAHVPSCRRVELRAENWPHHYQTFFLHGEDEPQAGWVALDTLIEAHGFEVEFAEYVVPNTDNIIIIARREGGALEVAA